MVSIGVIDAQLNQPGQNLEHLMVSGLDATKTISSLTLFEAAGLASATTLLNQLGRSCAWTQAQLNAQEGWVSALVGSTSRKRENIGSNPNRSVPRGLSLFFTSISSACPRLLVPAFQNSSRCSIPITCG